MTSGAYDRLGGEFLVNSATAGAQTGATIAALASGGFIMTWTDASGQGGDGSGSGIKAQLYDATGNRVGTEFLVNTATLNAQKDSTVTALASGGFVVSWNDLSGQGGDASYTSVKAQIYDAAGIRSGGEFLVNTVTNGDQSTPAITSLSTGGFVATWTDSSGLAPDKTGTGVKGQIFDAAGLKVGTEFLVNTVTPGSQLFNSVTSLSTGGFVATWTDNSKLGTDTSDAGIKAQIFSATGVKIGAEFLVNTQTFSTQDHPVVTSLAGGGFVVVWRDLSQADDHSSSGIKAQVYNASGAKVGGEVLVNTQQVNAQDQPTVTSTPDGGFAVSWRDNSLLSGDTSSFGIKLQAFDAAGVKIGTEFLVNTTTLNSQEQPKIVALASGALVVSWTDYSLSGGDASTSSIKAQIFNPSSKTISDIALSSISVAETSVENLSVATLAAAGALNAKYSYQLISDSTNGAFGVVGDRVVVLDSLKLDYEVSTSASLIIRAVDGFGNSFDKVVTLAITDSIIETRYAASADLLTNTVTAENQLSPTVASLASGGYVVSWADASGIGGDASLYGIKAQIYDAGGAKVGAEFLVNTTTLQTQVDPAAVSLSSGGFVISWSDRSAVGADASDYGIKAQLFAANGSAVGPELQVNTATLGAQTQSSVASLGTGFIVTWTDASGQGGDTSGTGVKAQLFDAAGAKVGGEILVNTNTANVQDSAVATALDSGNFVVSWHDTSGRGGDDSKDSIKAQVFDASGGKIGSEFLVNTETQSNQQAPTIAALDTGGFVISWADNSGRGGDSDYYGIKAQLYDADGNRLGAEFLVNTTTLNAQIQPVATALSYGGFVISWADYSGTNSEQGTAGIKAQMFDDFGQKLGSEFAVNTQTLGAQVEPAVALLPAGGFVIGWTDYSGQNGDTSGTGINTKLFAPLPGQGPPPHIITTPDTLSGVEDQASTFLAAGLTANDRDAGGSALTITGVTAVSGGTVSLDANGDVLFNPTANFDGRASFTYTVVDEEGFTAIGRASVAVAGTPDAPTAVADVVTIGQNGGRILAATLLANDFDPDTGDRLSIVGVPAVSVGGYTLLLDSGGISYSPGTTFQSLGVGQTATDSFDYTIQDLSGVTSTATVALTIAGINDAPFALALSNVRVDENAVNGTVVGNASALDPDNGDTLSYSLTDSAGGRFAVDAATGVVRVLNGSLLDYEVSASHQIVARATDAHGLYVDATFSIALNNLPELKNYIGDNGANNFAAPTYDLWTIDGQGGSDTLTGNNASDTIYGGAGNDTIDGSGGADQLIGGIGNDVYYIDDAGDHVIENVGEGVDIVNSTVSYAMEPNIENLTLIGTANINAVGNDFNNTINGNSGDNLIDGGVGKDYLLGGDGNDTLVGGVGNDTMSGGNGNDVLVGGAGLDDLTGGAGADRFAFDSITVTADRDVVRDFTHGTDTLSFSQAVFTAFSGLPLGEISASSFGTGTQASNSAQHLIYNVATGGLFYDVDGIGGAAQIQIAILGVGTVLDSHDIFIVA